MDPQKNPGGLDVSGVFLFPHHLRRVQVTDVRTAARSPESLEEKATTSSLMSPSRCTTSLNPDSVANVASPSPSVNATPSIRSFCVVGRQGTVRDLQRRSVVLQATSMASTTKPGPKARATQGSAAPAFRSRSRMKSTVGDDMFPWLRSTSRDTSK